jgi:hypothetical protein
MAWPTNLGSKVMKNPVTCPDILLERVISALEGATEDQQYLIDLAGARVARKWRWTGRVQENARLIDSIRRRQFYAPHNQEVQRALAADMRRARAIFAKLEFDPREWLDGSLRPESGGWRLPLAATGVMDVVSAVTDAEGESTMTSPTEKQPTETPTGTSQEPKPTRKARVGARRAHVVPSKAKAGQKAASARKRPKTAKGTKPAHSGAGPRQGSKTAKVLDLLKRPGGATQKELMKATGWLPHSVRGFISGTLCKRMGLTVASVKGEDGKRSYSIKA